MLRDHCIFCWWKKEGRIWYNIICLKLHQFERISWWCLSIMEYALQSVMEFVTNTPGDHETLSIVYHVDFSSRQSSLDL